MNEEEQEGYNMKFNEVINEMFHVYPSKYEVDHQLAKFKENLASVDIEFEGARVSFFIHYGTRFRDLRQRVSSYWSMSIDDIFFSDTKPNLDSNPNPPVFLINQFVMNELYS